MPIIFTTEDAKKLREDTVEKDYQRYIRKIDQLKHKKKTSLTVKTIVKDAIIERLESDGFVVAVFPAEYDDDMNFIEGHTIITWT